MFLCFSVVECDCLSDGFGVPEAIIELKISVRIQMGLLLITSFIGLYNSSQKTKSYMEIVSEGPNTP